MPSILPPAGNDVQADSGSARDRAGRRAYIRIMYAILLAMLCSAADPAPAEGWVELFNGHNLDGWVARGGRAKYAVEDGCIVGRSAPNTPNSFLCTSKTFDNFILELEFKIDADLNSGVQVRSEFVEEGKTVESAGKTVKGRKSGGTVFGYQVEIDPDVKRNRLWTGGLYDESRRGWLKDLKDNDAARKAFKPGAWNRLRIECRGDTIKTWVNGVAAAELHDTTTPSGFIGLQVHGVKEKKEPLEVRFRNIRIQPLGR
jgi:hypothetical protein